MKQILFIFSLSFTIPLFGQEIIDFNNFHPTRCRHSIPNDLTASAKKNYEKNASLIDESEKGKNRKKDEKEFYLQNNFSIQDFLLSGQILYNDTFTNYIQKIANVLLQENPVLRAKLRFYCVRNTEVNAFATQEGIIFFNVGLFAQVKNEAQIAFILAHEISHYTEGHVLQGFLETKKIMRGENYYGFMDYYSRVRSFFRYSRDSELEADQKGWDLFKKSPYSKSIVSSVFDMLLYSYTHFDSFNFDIKNYEEKKYKFPSNYQLNQTTPLVADENRDDNFSTHPNVRDRKKKIRVEIGSDTLHGKDFVVSKNDFYSIQKIARYDMARYYITQANFADAYYHALLIEKIYGGGVYIDKIKAIALYGLAKYVAVEGKKDYLILPYDKVQSLPQQYYYFLSNLSQKELTIFAAREIQKLMVKHPDYKFLAKLEDDLLKTLIEDLKTKPEEFYSSWQSNIGDDKDKNANYYRYAFVDKMSNPQWFQKMQSLEMNKETKQKYFTSNSRDKNSQTFVQKIKQFSPNNLTMFLPAFQQVVTTFSGSSNIAYMESLQERNYIISQVNTISKLNKVAVDFVEKTPENYTTESYNTYSEYINWLTEQKYSKNIKMIAFDDYLSDTASTENYFGLIEFESKQDKLLVKNQHFWKYKFIIYNRNNNQMVYNQSFKSSKKYSQKKAKKILNSSFKTITKNHQD